MSWNIHRNEAWLLGAVSHRKVVQQDRKTEGTVHSAESANVQFLLGGSDEPRWNRDTSQHGFTSIWPSSTQKPRYSQNLSNTQQRLSDANIAEHTTIQGASALIVLLWNFKWKSKSELSLESRVLSQKEVRNKKIGATLWGPNWIYRHFSNAAKHCGWNTAEPH